MYSSINKEDMVLLLLCYLPKSFDGLITILVYRKNTLVYEEIVSILISNEQKEKTYKRSSNNKVLTLNEIMVS